MIHAAATILLAGLTLFSSSAAAQYLSTKTSWDNMDRNAQISYAAGLYDGLFVAYSGDSPSDMASVLGASRCFLKLELAASDLERVASFRIHDSQIAHDVIPFCRGRYGGHRWANHIRLSYERGLSRMSMRVTDTARRHGTFGCRRSS